MTFPIGLLLAIIVAALVMFSLELFSADVTALAILLTLVLTGLLPAGEAFAGFGSDAVIMILGLFILTAALVRTGVVDQVSQFILNNTSSKLNRLNAVVMVTSAALSSLMSNTATTAFFVPVIIGIARKTKNSVSKMLLPLAFSSILASSVTLVGTSTNIVISGMLGNYGLESIGMFELTLVGVPIVLVGLLYMLLLGQHLIPDRTQAGNLQEQFGIRPYLSEILVLADSPLIDKSLADSGLGRDLDLTVLRLERGEEEMPAPQADLVLQEDDRLLVKGPRDELLRVKDRVGVDIEAEVHLSLSDLETTRIGLVEAVLLHQSPLVGKTLEQVHFRHRYGAQVLGINRRGKTLSKKISQIPLQVGDILLLQGDLKSLSFMDENNTFRVIGTVEYQQPNRAKAPLAVAIFAAVIGLAALNVLSLPVAVMLGSLIAFLTRCLSPEDAYDEVQWKALIVIGCMLALGRAMEITGTAEYLASGIVGLVGQDNPTWMLSGFFLLSLLLTQPMSNQAAAVVVVPVAIQTAFQLDLNPRTFAMMIAVAASCSYLTPLEPACLMVYGPGRYRFTDFLKVGALLTVLIYILAIVLVPRLWPL
ncbi:MAG: SLC13 family permease [Anaerolineales bacterium]|nr:SLC13 family permease [Anaerolineales bacterium]